MSEQHEAQLILDALVCLHQREREVVSDLRLNTPCSECGGSTFCPRGCPMHTCRLGEFRWPHLSYEPIREHEYRRAEDGYWDEVLVAGKECSACTIYGTCMSCGPGGEGKERRAATRKGSVYLIDRQSHLAYYEAGFQMADPIRIPRARVEKAIEESGSELTLFSAVTP